MTTVSLTVAEMARLLCLKREDGAHYDYDYAPCSECLGLARSIAEELSNAIGHRWHRQGGGWWCCVCENQCHKSHPCVNHAPCVPVPKATLCGGPHGN